MANTAKNIIIKIYDFYTLIWQVYQSEFHNAGTRRRKGMSKGSHLAPEGMPPKSKNSIPNRKVRRPKRPHCLSEKLNICRNRSRIIYIILSPSSYLSLSSDNCYRSVGAWAWIALAESSSTKFSVNRVKSFLRDL